MKQIKRIVLLFLFAAAVTGILFAAGSSEKNSKGTIVFGDVSWDSVKVHNRIAGFIIQHGYGYTPEYTPGETITIYQGMMQGDIDVNMESWSDNVQEAYDKGVKAGSIIDLGPNYPDSEQGWYIPTYMIKGDTKRGIKASAPDLTSVEMLPKYWELFKDPENPSKGRLFVGPPGWGATKVGQEKMTKLGLDKTYNAFLPGSDAALSGSMIAAYKKGEPWVGYYWAPTWVLGSLDMTMLKGSEWPPAKVNILINPSVKKKAPEIVEFLTKYETTTPENNEFLAIMKEKEYSTDDAAMWFLKNKEDKWSKWVSKEVHEKVKKALTSL